MKWEYARAISYALGGHVRNWELQGAGVNLGGYSAGSFDDILHKMGLDGWEIIDTNQRFRETDGLFITTIWLKRLIQEATPYAPLPTLQFIDGILASVARSIAGYQGRIGAVWVWQLPGERWASMRLGKINEPSGWDVIHGEISTPSGGVYNQVAFPLALYAPTQEDGSLLWNEDAQRTLQTDIARWLTLMGQALAVQIQLNDLETRLIRYAVDELDGKFIIGKLHAAFKGEITRSALSALAENWEAQGWLQSGRPRRLSSDLVSAGIPSAEARGRRWPSGSGN